MENKKWVYAVLVSAVVLIALLGWFLLGRNKQAQELSPEPLPAAAVAGKEIKFETILKGQQSGVKEKRNFIIKNEADWQALWKQMGQTGILPAVDFSGEMVIAVFMGEKNTGGYGVEIVKIMERNAGLEVSVVESVPESDQVVTQALTSPFHLVRLPFSNKEVIFKSVLGAEKGF